MGILKSIIIIVLASMASLPLHAQSLADIQSPQIIPPSPDAAALGKYGAIPVDKSTGIPQISIPLYEIKTPRFSLPISLSYHASGIKVDEIASWVGMGWSLNAGGVITRSIVGLPDDYGGFLFTTVPKASDIQWPRDSLNIVAGIRDGVDTKPDNFFYNFSGQSGAFVFGIDKEPVLIPYAALRITFDTASGFHIIDEQGNRYDFNSTETVESTINNHIISPKSSWYLTQMISADLSDTIQFNYTLDSLVQNEFSYNFSQILGPQYVGRENLGFDILYPLTFGNNERTYRPLRISRIVFKGGKVDFISKGGRLDNANVSLDSVIVSNYNTATGQYSRLKSFKLLTDYFFSDITGEGRYIFATSPYQHRLKLAGLSENDQNNIPVKTHYFDYNPTQLPPVNNFGQDKWGYYNGKFGNQTLLESQRIVTNGTNTDVVGGLYGADRSVSPENAQACMLTKITYPTGGHTSFSYESNQILQASPVFLGFSAFVDGTESYTDTVTYIPTDSILGSGGNILNIQITMYHGLSVIPYVEVIDSALGLIFTKNANEFSPVDSNVTLSLVAGHHYRLIAVTQALTGTSSDPSFTPFAQISTAYQTATDTVLTPVGGIRVASIQNYGSDNSLLSTETYKYGDNESGAGELLASAFTTNSLSQIAQFQMSIIGECDGCAANLETSGITTYFNNSVYQLASLNGSAVGYPTVSVYHGNVSQNTGKSVYSYAIFSDSIQLCPESYQGGVNPVPVTWKNGEPIKEDHYRNVCGGRYKLEQEKNTVYNYVSKTNARGLIWGVAFQTFGFSYLTDAVVTSGGVELFLSPTTFYWFDYPISSGIRIPARTILNEYDTSGSTVLLTDTTNYYYDDSTLFMPTRTATTDSKGHSSLIYSYRPLQKTAINTLNTLSSTASAAIDSMVARNMISPVLEQVQYRNNNFTQASLTNYQNWDSHIVAPQNIQVQIGSNPLDTRLQFNAYDSRGNVLELQKTNDVKQVYLWGYNGEYPVAKLLNTTYTAASALINQSVLDRPADDATLRSQLNNLRGIAQAQVTGYTYQPMVGMTSQSDAQNRITYYEYDALQRLKRIRDQDLNIVKTYDYQYGFTSTCAGNCSIVTMQTLGGTNTIGYPVGVFNVHGKLLGNVANQAAFVSLWNADTADAHAGTLAAGGDSLHFAITTSGGETLPAITGCRYYQVDLHWNKLDGVRNLNGTYVDFGDGTGMHLGRMLNDTPAVIAPNTTYTTIFGFDRGVYETYFVHTYSDTSLKTLTFYHNDANESEDFDNVGNGPTGLTTLTHLRGNLPQNTTYIGGSSYQQRGMTSVDSIHNWNSISSIQYFRLNNGDLVDPAKHISYAQDFLANDKGLINIFTNVGGYYGNGYRDTSFRLSRLKSDWNTYFTGLQYIAINEDHWNREDLTALAQLSFLQIVATTADHQDDSASAIVPLPSSEIDTVIMQVAAGAGQVVSNGSIYMDSGGSARTSASDDAVALLKAKGWQIYVNRIAQ